jgi:peptidoglycan/LPS O-acetylase OafA/YrhL
MVHMAVIWSFSQVLRLGLKIPQIISENGDPLLIPDPLTGFLFLTTAIACTLFMSYITYTYIEDPCRKISKKLAEQWFPASPAGCARTTGPGIPTNQPRYAPPEI